MLLKGLFIVLLSLSCVTLFLSLCSFYFTCNVAVLANGKGFTMGEGGGGRAIGLAQDFPVHDDKIVSVF